MVVVVVVVVVIALEGSLWVHTEMQRCNIAVILATTNLIDIL